jgi:hypothetical protein
LEGLEGKEETGEGMITFNNFDFQNKVSKCVSWQRSISSQPLSESVGGSVLLSVSHKSFAGVYYGK